jgi:hypothetical protein
VEGKLINDNDPRTITNRPNTAWLKSGRIAPLWYFQPLSDAAADRNKKTEKKSMLRRRIDFHPLSDHGKSSFDENQQNGVTIFIPTVLVNINSPENNAHVGETCQC